MNDDFRDAVAGENCSMFFQEVGLWSWDGKSHAPEKTVIPSSDSMLALDKSGGTTFTASCLGAFFFFTKEENL